MADSSKLPKKISKLFAPRPPLTYISPDDIDPAHRSNVRIEAVSSVITNSLLSSYAEEINLASSGEDMEMSNNAQGLLASLKKTKTRTKVILPPWNPLSDPNIRGNPYCTVFISKLPSAITEDMIKQAIPQLNNDIEKISIVMKNGDKLTTKMEHTGYAFILFKNEKSAVELTKKGLFFLQDGKKIMVDAERGRTVKNWRPKKHGGGVSHSYNSYSSSSHHDGNSGSRFAHSRVGPRRGGGGIHKFGGGGKKFGGYGTQSGPRKYPRSKSYY